MSKLQTSIILLRAISRLSFRMAFFMVRRLTRNYFAVKFSHAYYKRMASIESSIPVISNPLGIPSGLADMAEFYCTEYSAMFKDVTCGRVSLYGKTVDFDTVADIDWNRSLPEEGDHQMWRVKLAHMGFICPMLLDENTDNHEAVIKLITGAKESADMTAPGAFNAFWFPYAASHRILAIGSGFLVARAKGSLSPEIDAAVADFLRLNAAFVLDNIEYELCNNHVERNLAALCLYFSYVNTVPSAIVLLLERDIARYVDRAVLDDGTQVERSPMYQGLCVASLSIMAETPFLSEDLRNKLMVKVGAARRAFSLLCHPDGEIALFNDAWHGEVPRWTGLAPPDGRSVLPQGGYGRLSLDSDLCLMDAGPLGPSWNPGHGHADFLSIEVTLNGNRVIVDPGTSRYNTGYERIRERSAIAHNGPVWIGYEPVEFLGCFKVGRMAKAQLIQERLLPPDTVAGYICDGPGKIGRMVRYYPGHGYLVADLWLAKVPGQVTWLIPASWEVVPVGIGFKLRDTGLDAQVVITPILAINDVAIVQSCRARYYGQLEDAYELSFRPQQGQVSQSLLSWIGRTEAPEDAVKNGTNMLGQIETLINAN